MAKQDLVSFGQRIKAVRKALDFNQKDFAKTIGISNSFLSELEAGHTKASYDFFFNLSRQHRVNIHFLLHGQGDIIYEPSAEPPKLERDFGDFNDKVHEMLWYFENSPMVKMAVLGFYSRFMYDNEDYIAKDIKKHKGSNLKERLQP